MQALNDNGTWNFIQLPARKKAIRCRWMFIVKVNSDGSVARLRAQLVTKGMLRPMAWTILTLFPLLLRRHLFGFLFP